jgi:hypothetical protein
MCLQERCRVVKSLRVMALLKKLSLRGDRIREVSVYDRENTAQRHEGVPQLGQISRQVALFKQASGYL